MITANDIIRAFEQRKPITFHALNGRELKKLFSELAAVRAGASHSV
ncbi:hypothetical protein [Photobacterium frigidiphilum]|nr:hypothetical protein [Photobacterium frigidiphilum]